MTLNEAIKHCLEVAEKAEVDANYINLFGETPDELGRTLASCIRCAEEHRQLAEWLKELKERRKMTNTVRVVYVSLKGVKMPKYLIDIPDGSDTEYTYDQDTKELKFPSPRIDPTSFMGLEIVLTNVTPYTEDEVWELIKDINYLGYDDFVACFNGMTEEQVFELSYQEVKEKYEAWKRKEEEVRVGDEVIIKSDGVKGVVLDEDLCGEFSVFTENGCCEAYRKIHFEKTGRHFPEVAELLKKMREEE